EEPLADPPARVGAIEYRQMLIAKMRRTFQRHRAAAVGIRGLDLIAREAERGQHIETVVIQLIVAEAEDIAAEFFAEREFVEDKLDIEAARKSRLDLFQNIVREALGAERFVIDAGRAVERCMADRVVDDAFRFK